MFQQCHGNLRAASKDTGERREKNNKNKKDTQLSSNGRPALPSHQDNVDPGRPLLIKAPPTVSPPEGRPPARPASDWLGPAGCSRPPFVLLVGPDERAAPPPAAGEV